MSALPGQMGLITLLDVCLKVFRVLGFLPYSWDAAGRGPQISSTQAPGRAWSTPSLLSKVNLRGSDKTLSSPAFPCCFKKRQLLVALSWLFVLINIAHCLAIISVHLTYIPLDVFEVGNFKTTSSITDTVIHLFSVFLCANLLAVLLWRSDQLAHLLQSLSNIIAKHNIAVVGKVDTFVWFVFLLFTMGIVVIAALKLQQEAETETETQVDMVKKRVRSFETTSFYITQLLFTLTVTVLVLLFRAVAAILSENYANILREKLPRETPPDMTQVWLANCGEQEVEADGERKSDDDARKRKMNYALQDITSAAHVNDMETNNAARWRKMDYASQDLSSYLHGGMVTQGDERKEKAPPPSPLTIKDVTTATDQMHDLHQIQHLVNTYFGLPLALSLVKMMMQVTLDAFLAASTTDMLRLGCIVVAVTLDVCLLVHLFSAPDCVTQQVGA